MDGFFLFSFVCATQTYTRWRREGGNDTLVKLRVVRKYTVGQMCRYATVYPTHHTLCENINQLLHVFQNSRQAADEQRNSAR